jgi:hypothetical protein
VSVVAILDSGERVTITDTWETAKRLLKEGGYTDVERIEHDDKGKESTDE